MRYYSEDIIRDLLLKQRQECGAAYVNFNNPMAGIKNTLDVILNAREPELPLDFISLSRSPGLCYDSKDE